MSHLPSVFVPLVGLLLPASVMIYLFINVQKK
uniref:Photosystem I reaction center subunit VIII n=1 Tax=Cuscuta reflexa TaxID=4129 RepID=A7M976_CUSRE|nr:photosystem I subunit VIII [Cuscuta reflexa]CAM98404.1 PSI subunit VIII [Cuscuta reflexa]